MCGRHVLHNAVPPWVRLDVLARVLASRVVATRTVTEVPVATRGECRRSAAGDASERTCDRAAR